MGKMPEAQNFLIPPRISNKENLKNSNNIKESGGKMGCYVMVTNRLFLG